MNLKILKLRSGEELACQVIEENDSTLKVFKPMVFKTLSSFDPSGMPYDMITLHDWLMNTDDKTIDMPTNHIVISTIPNDDTVKLYEVESSREFDKDNIKTTLTENTMTDQSQDLSKITESNMFSDMVRDMIQSTFDMEDNYEDSQPPRRKRKKTRRDRDSRKKSNLPPDMMDESELDRHMIMMQLYIPAESIMNLITSGVIQPQVLLDMIEEVKKRNRFTGDEKTRKDFGDKLSDWNPDPESVEYL